MATDTSSQQKEQADDASRRCTYCGSKAPLIWVHGHGQCANCGINVRECCQGETCQTE